MKRIRWRHSYRLQIWGVIALALGLLGIVLAWLSFKPVAWQLSLTANTEIARMKISDALSWQLKDAVICVKETRSPSIPQEHDPVCKGRQWHRTGEQGASGARVLRLEASPDHPIDVQIESLRSGELRMALRQSGQGRTLGTVQSLETGQIVAHLGTEVNILWPALTRHEVISQEEDGSVVLPFSGAITVGRDVSWSTEKMLVSGEISVFSASDDHLAGRTIAEQSTLVLGDRVDIESLPQSFGTPKGFLRVDRLAAATDQPNTMMVVVHAPAGQATVHRYGGGFYRFEASWWVRLKHQSSLVIVLVLLTGLLSILNSLAGIIPALPRLFGWCCSAFGRPESARTDDTGDANHSRS